MPHLPNYYHPEQLRNWQYRCLGMNQNSRLYVEGKPAAPQICGKSDDVHNVDVRVFVGNTSATENRLRRGDAVATPWLVIKTRLCATCRGIYNVTKDRGPVQGTVK